MAKLAYPDRFGDVDLAAHAEALLGRIYQVDAATAGRLRRALWIDDATAD
jgi:hypothetical protein